MTRWEHGPRHLESACLRLVLLALASLAAGAVPASGRMSDRGVATAASAPHVTLGMGSALHGGGVLTGVRLHASRGASYQKGKLSLPVAKLTLASGGSAILALRGSVRLTDRGHELLLSKLQIRFGPQGSVTFSTGLSGGGRASVFTGMANSSPVTASGISATSAPMALGGDGNRLIAKLEDVQVEAVQAQFIGDMKVPAVAASGHADRP